MCKNIFNIVSLSSFSLFTTQLLAVTRLVHCLSSHLILTGLNISSYKSRVLYQNINKQYQISTYPVRPSCVRLRSVCHAESNILVLTFRRMLVQSGIRSASSSIELLLSERVKDKAFFAPSLENMTFVAPKTISEYDRLPSEAKLPMTSLIFS